MYRRCWATPFTRVPRTTVSMNKLSFLLWSLTLSVHLYWTCIAGFPRVSSVMWIRIRIDSGRLDPDPDSGGQKCATKKRTKWTYFMFWSAGCFYNCWASNPGSRAGTRSGSAFKPMRTTKRFLPVFCVIFHIFPGLLFIFSYISRTVKVRIFEEEAERDSWELYAARQWRHCYHYWAEAGETQAAQFRKHTGTRSWGREESQ